MADDPTVIELFATDPNNPTHYDSHPLSYAALMIRHANLVRDVQDLSRRSPVHQIASGPTLMMQANALMNDMLEGLGKAEAKLAEKSS